jgi:hypothetical protein
MGGSSNDWELHSQLSAIQRVASKAIQEGNSVNLANIDTAFDKKAPPQPKVIKDEFGSKIARAINFKEPAAEFSSNSKSSITNIDPFKKTNRDYQALRTEEIAKRSDVLKSLGIMENERRVDDVFSSRFRI